MTQDVAVSIGNRKGIEMSASSLWRSNLALLAACSVALSACGSEPTYAETATDEDTAIEMASDDLSDQSFEEVGDTSLCTEDCSGHDAGFEWARENGVTDPSECGGNSQSFIEGCETYAESVQEQADKYMSESEY